MKHNEKTPLSAWGTNLLDPMKFQLSQITRISGTTIEQVYHLSWRTEDNKGWSWVALVSDPSKILLQAKRLKAAGYKPQKKYFVLDMNVGEITNPDMTDTDKLLKNLTSFLRAK